MEMFEKDIQILKEEFMKLS